MRLLHTTRLEVVYFAADVPPYAILSHTWDDDEVTFQDVQSSGTAKQMRGYAKLEESCSLASGEGFEYIWVDSCCIDKTSSAELSEAINSMFRWYREAQICYAYLSDVRWFTRGWTLQELIAPKRIHFYNQNWSFIGTRDDSAEVLATVTSIPESILIGGESSWTPINQRMHWAASRQTTRPEDIAYCLPGIFDVHIPLIYGEGRQKAFRRLQEEIIKTSEDLTIYLWRLPRAAWKARDQSFWDVLAEDPLWFSGSVPGFRDSTSLTQLQDSSVNITNRGVAVKWYIVPLPYDASEAVFLALLTECGGVSDGIFIQRRNHEGSEFSRIVPRRVVSIETKGRDGRITLPYAETGVDVPLRHVQTGQLCAFYLMRNTASQHLGSSFGVMGFCFVDSNLMVRRASSAFAPDSVSSHGWCARIPAEWQRPWDLTGEPGVVVSGSGSLIRVMGALSIDLTLIYQRGAIRKALRSVGTYSIVCGFELQPRTALQTPVTCHRPFACFYREASPEKAINIAERDGVSKEQFGSLVTVVGRFTLRLERTARVTGFWYDIVIDGAVQDDF
ncbi:vegetative incompatibility protein HET-E-1 [Colletotrichum tofieldiae]|uniref:Vegetative incompatibility protein HET-E-1 n=1 Tax=Colletotrichum tofieldiae TaxID=708197 RepID=A0A161W693_9PEZI|nr:vegetative incompatibility protein HET-E-1 [Colletotrichum tofieldiae]GKT90580.1 vegetative incompatibility protein HET-E-1 [Colletotrichum tofieldiae]